MFCYDAHLCGQRHFPLKTLGWIIIFFSLLEVNSQLVLAAACSANNLLLALLCTHALTCAHVGLDLRYVFLCAYKCTRFRGAHAAYFSEPSHVFA